jgi:phosphoribosyl-ATP pyrophosphohydrolase
MGGMSFLARHARAARLAVGIGLASTVHLSLASAIVLLPSIAEAADKGSSTEKLIKEGKEKFEEGLYEESIEKLSAAILKQDITKDQKIEALRLLMYNYLVRTPPQEDSARAAAYQIFALDEDYELSKKESPRFREPFAKFKKQWVDEGKPGQAKAEKVPAPVVIKHSPATEVPHDQSIAISGSFDDPEKRVAKMSLFYRAGTSGKFTEGGASVTGSTFAAKVPAVVVKPPLVEYYVLAFDEGGIPIANRGDADTPLRVAVAGDSGSVFGTWWFWTGAAAVVGGVVVGGILLSRSKTPAPGPVGPPTSTVTVIIGN